MPTTHQLELRDRPFVQPASCCVNTTAFLREVARYQTGASRTGPADQRVGDKASTNELDHRGLPVLGSHVL